MASSSSSHQQNDSFSGIEPAGKRRKVSESSRLFDVFINHRGPDVKQTLAPKLYNSLQDLGIKAFLDCEEKEFGDSFPSTIETAIRSASVHIAIFSKTYAESAWCLDELVLMLQSKAKIIPVFYDVQPWELRYIEKGEYAHAFTYYKEKSRHMEKLEKWKEALQTVSLYRGWDFYNSDVFEDIVSAVEKEVKRTESLYVAKYPVGLDNLVQDFEKRCIHELVQDFEKQCGLNEKGKEKAKAVGIFGLGGSGKTTLSKELFNRKRVQYARSCFLFDVREVSGKGQLASLQIQLIRDLFNEDPPNFRSREEGMIYIKDRLESSSFLSFLLILDDIDDVEQLDALLFRDIINKSANSLLIVTTPDVGLLISTGINIGYKLKGMNRNDARELFCWHAFGQPSTARSYEGVVDDFVDVCEGLPLSLQILGRHVRGRDLTYWSLELDKTRKTLPGDIKTKLKISFDALEMEEKQMFMDISCFFINKSVDMVTTIWEGCGWNARHALQTLKDKCLINEVKLCYDDELRLEMHHHLRDLGRAMAEEMSAPSRLWHPQKLKSLELKGFQTILAQINIRCFQSFIDRTMDAEITYFIGNSEDLSETSASLLWLELNYLNGHNHMTCIPSWIPLKNLQCLRINNGHFKRLWQSDAQAPSSLKELHITETSLEELPDFSSMSSHLKKIYFEAEGMTTEDWSSLEFLIIEPRILVIGPSTLYFHDASNDRGQLVSFMYTTVIFSNFKLRGVLALNNWGRSPTVKCPMSTLEKLEIEGQNHVTKILISGYRYPNLQSLHLVSMENLTAVELDMVTTLSSLHLIECENLKNMSGICDLTDLVELKIYGCPQLEELPCLFHLSCLKSVSIGDCSKLNDLQLGGFSISSLTNLVELKISGCSELEELPCLFHLSCLKSVSIGDCLKLNGLQLVGCDNLRTVEVFDVPKLAIFNISHCPQLEELAPFKGQSFLERITIEGCGKLNCLDLCNCEILKTLSGNVNVAEFRITDCPKLEELSTLSGVEKLTIIRCEMLQNITLPTTLTYVEVEGRKEWKTVPGISDLTNLVTLMICNCLELEELSVVGLSCLETIRIESCEKLQNIAGTENLLALKDMQLSLCSNAAIRNSVHRLQRVPSEHLTVIGSAVDGAKSILSSRLFSDCIGGETIIEIKIEIGLEDSIFVAPPSLHFLDTMPEKGSLSAIILCTMVSVHNLSSNKCRVTWWSRQGVPSHQFPLDIGQRIFTTVITDQELINYYIENPQYSYPGIWSYGDTGEVAIEKAYMVTVKKGEEWKTLTLIKIICDQLLEK